MRDILELLEFLTNTMSMTEIYQPVIILHLLKQGGIASKEELAQILSGYDESDQEYYEKILMRWPKKTLTKHKIVSYDRKNKKFYLNFKLTNASLVEKAMMICEEKTIEWIEKKASKNHQEEKKTVQRYRILKRAKGEL